MYVCVCVLGGGVPSGLNSRESAFNAGVRVQSQGWEDSLEKGMATQSIILAWRIMDRWAYPWDHKQLDMTE